MARAKQVELRDGVELTNLDQPLFSGADATKRDLVDYLDAVAGPLLRELAGRPLSVVRVRPGAPPFMQKNLPDYAPDFVRSVTVWSDAGHREIHYPICEDRRTLLWLANQRAVEYHPTLMLPATPSASQERVEILAGAVTHLVLDIDPPEGSGFDVVVATARLVQAALTDAGLRGAVKTSGSKGVHVIVPVTGIELPDAAAATRALAARAERLDPSVATTAYIKADRGGKVFLDATRSGGASLACCYSPRVRPGVPVSYPVPWEDLEEVTPAAFTIRSVPAMLDGDPWAASLPSPQTVPADVIAEGHTIPVARVAAMHEGKRRKRAAERDAAG
ncbi:DNA primase small subunit [Beutenbergia cavernae DSM 12333]|uniref:DNA primase small subunit n=1 Tax=Beutenbergia cavernae (strain ATCC BAA-8 / DSM 12333 / CCUG 43141 / JCM 11478 / NBRC 16432 / NCIMB 13614 / HKI 0122) TaxID=471853 RepID=C5C649_BEUC1|nr:ATP-dependent DNA ligase [Beutenbergia cavernae]ACQ82407.1 DNA primase small subunit [Beutenbergia cavernae DSM 12333]